MSEGMTYKEAIVYLNLCAEEAKSKDWGSGIKFALEFIQNAIPITPKQEPCEDAVSRGVFEQVMWERDVAIEQLKELGYGFGEKPRTGHWIKNGETDENGNAEYMCSECTHGDVHAETQIVPFCWWCGTKMVEPQESEDRCIKCANNGMIDDECAYCTNHNLFKAESED